MEKMFTFEGMMVAAMEKVSVDDESYEMPNYREMTFDDAWEKFINSQCEENVSELILDNVDLKKWEEVIKDFIPMYPNENVEYMYKSAVAILSSLIENIIKRFESYVKCEASAKILILDDLTTVLVIKEENFPYWEYVIDNEVDFIVTKVQNGYLTRRNDLRVFYPYVWRYYNAHELSIILRKLPEKLSEKELELVGESTDSQTKVEVEISDEPGSIRCNSVYSALYLIKNLK